MPLPHRSPSPSSSSPVLAMHLFSFTFLFLLSFSPISLSLNGEGFFLQSVKNSLDDPAGSLSSWNEADDTPCTWFGISCDTPADTVISIDLSSARISGPFPSQLCQLTNLHSLTLFNNSINSTLPSDISACTSLQYLDLAQNLLTGLLPPTLADLPNLRHLDLSANNFSGEIPPSFGRFQKLEAISLILNLMDGPIPPFLGNITSLRMLNLSFNPFAPSIIPPELGNLKKLEVLWLSACNLVGEIPESLGQLNKLVLLDLSSNRLTGPFPRSFTELSSVYQIELFNNSLSGELPDAFSKLTSLRLFDVSMNSLTGSLPDELCRLPIESLNLFENRLEGNLPEIIADSTTLYEIKLFRNRFTGELPKHLGKHSPLRSLDISNNHFSGKLPDTLCENGELVEIMMLDNMFSGEIPASLAECHVLTRVRLANNRLSGHIPEKLWGLPSVYLLELSNNTFSGPISKSIGGAINLGMLLISHNNFSGTIPQEIGFLENLVEFSAGNNNLIGYLPESIVKMRNLARLDLPNNELSGRLRSDLEAWVKLNELNLANNNFSGVIPKEISSLPVLNYLDLSSNQFSGEIPFGLQNLNLNVLNLSYNHLTGRLPSYFEGATYRHSFLGNPGLCREKDGVCVKEIESKSEVGGGGIWLLRSVFALGGLVFIAGVVLFHLQHREFTKANSLGLKSKSTIMSFHKLSFREDEIVGCLDEDNVIGSGASGQVYKVVLSNGEIVAVKKLWAEAPRDRKSSVDLEKDWNVDNSFDAEVEILGKIRHKNIVKLWCSCTNGDSKLLVYEYMPNGSLGDMLHGSKGELLDWPARYKIALDTAEGLSYLHHDCVPPIVHRDVKSNNILLDVDFRARIADFGVATAIEISKEAKTMPVIAGSCGYIAPEYAYTLKVNEKSDIYSYGMVILELVTGRRPTDPEMGEKDLVKWVCSTLEQKGIDHIIDPKLDSSFKVEICNVLNIGLLCSSPLPINRPSMRRVVKLLQEVRWDERSKNGKIDSGRLTPYYFEDDASSEQ